FLGHSVTKHSQIASATQRDIDEEVRAIIDRNYERAKTILDENSEKLHLMAQALIKYETIDREQIDDIMAGRQPRPPEGWTDSGGGDGGVGAEVAPENGSAKGKGRGKDDAIGDPAGQL
ncbi:MAG TPA: ATP-dependent metalloprotease, partial [Gammaproteobacteria bacterium]